MELTIETNKVEPLKLTEAMQAEVVNFVKEQLTKAKDERRDYKKQWETCDKAYKQELPPWKDKRNEWRSRECLPWAFDAVESAAAYFTSVLMPKNEELFKLDGRTSDDDAMLAPAEKALEYVLEQAQFADRIDTTIRMLLRKSQSPLKVMWRNASEASYKVNPETGLREQMVDVTYNGVWFDCIDIDDFYFYPICGPKSQMIKIHKTHAYTEDLIARAKAKVIPYFNMDKLKERQTEEEKNKALCLYEVWIPRIVIDGKVYKNYVATIADEDLLIRFQPNPYPDGETPFIFFPLIPDGLKQHGWPFVKPGMGIFHQANQQWNSLADARKLSTYPTLKYYDDGVFDPYKFISRPGGMVKVSEEGFVAGNVSPLMEDLTKIQMVAEELALLEDAFEKVTVPKSIKGMQEGGEATATEVNLVHSNSSSKLARLAQRINSHLIKPATALAYKLLATMYEADPGLQQELQRVVEDPSNPQQLVFPAEGVDIKVIGYDNYIKKQTMLNNTAMWGQNIIQTPAAKYVKWYELALDTASASDIDVSRVMVGEQEKQKIDEADAQAQQQAQEVAQQQSQMLMDIEQLKESNKRYIEEMKVQKDLQIELLKAALDQAKHESDQQLELNQEVRENLDDYDRDPVESGTNSPTEADSD